MVHRSVPLSTAVPLVTDTAVMVPSWGAMISFSIFMASKIISTSPDFTAWPAATFTSRMVPGMGAVICSPAPAGAAAGAEPDDVVLSRVHEAAKQKNVPVFCNTGCNHQNVREKLKHCDAVCIGSAFKKDGIFNQRVDEKRVRDFMEIVKEIRGES